jgi:hypothetical protein
MSKAPEKRGPLTDDELEKIAALGERGLNAGQIAQRLGGRSAATVYWRLLNLGLAKPKRGGNRKPYLRNGVLVIPYSAEEDAFIEALRVQGFKSAKIAELCSKRYGHRRTGHSIDVRLVMLAASETEDAPENRAVA